jgi:DNA-binding transcriptional ArsR family regulator
MSESLTATSLLPPTPADPQGAQLFKLLADENRLRLLRLLDERGEVSVSGLCRELGLSQPAVSHHLTMLRTGGGIDCRQQGHQHLYRLTSGPVREMLRLLR